MALNKKMAAAVIAAVLLLAIALAMTLAMLLFPSDKLITLSEQLLTESFKRPVSIGHIGLSFSGVVPSVKVTDVLIGPAKAGEEPLASIPSLEVTFNLFKLLVRKVEIASVDFDKPTVHIVLAQPDSLANGSCKEAPNAPGMQALPFPLTLNSLKIRHGTMEIENRDARFRLHLNDINQKASFSVSGDLTRFSSKGGLSVSNISFASLTTALSHSDTYRAESAANKTIDGVALELSHTLTGNLREGTFTLSRGGILINGIPFQVLGGVAGWKHAQFTIRNTDTRAENLLKAIPVSLIPGKNRMKLEGDWKFSLNGTVDTVSAKPAVKFDGVLESTSLRFSHAGLSSGMNDMSLRASFTERDLNIETLSVKTGRSQVTVSGTVHSYLSMPELAVRTEGAVTMEDASTLYPPLMKIASKGLINIALSVKGAPKKHESLEADGTVAFKELVCKPPESFRYPLHVNGAVRVTPAALLMDSISVTSGKSDFTLSGEFKEYTAILITDSTVHPAFKGLLTSVFIDLNDLIISSKDADIQFIKPWHMERTLKTLPLPPSLAASLSVKLGKVVFGRLKSDKASAVLSLSPGLLKLSDLSVTAYDGILSGLAGVDFSDTASVRYTIDMNLKDFDSGVFIADFFGTENFIRGKLSSSLTMSSAGLDSLSMLKNLIGEGTIVFEQGQVDNWDFAKKLGGYLKFLDFDHVNFDTITNSFIIRQQKVLTPNIAVKSAYGAILLDGACGFDSSLDYTMTLRLNKETSKKVLEHFTSAGTVIGKNVETVEVVVDVGGTLSKPLFKLDTTAMTTQAKQELKSKADKIIEENIKDETLRQETKKLLDKLIKKKR